MNGPFAEDRRGLSVFIIALNEEASLQACLESVAWADEVVVCDSGSMDKTVELCRAFGAKVFVDEWQGFAGHKNLCLERASFPWAFSLDADERVTPELRGEIEEILVHDGPFDGYFVPRRNFFLGRWIRRCGWYPDYTLRLFRRGKGRFKPRAVHEAAEVEGTVGYLRGPLLHYTYTSLSEYLQRMDRYSSLAAEELLRLGRRFSLPGLLLHPPLTFLKMFVLQKGFLEGTIGFLLSSLYAYYTFAKYAKLWELERSKVKE